MPDTNSPTPDFQTKEVRADDIQEQVWVSRQRVPMDTYANVVQVRVSNMDAEIHFGQILGRNPATGKVGIVEAASVVLPLQVLRDLGSLISGQIAMMEARLGPMQSQFANADAQGVVLASQPSLGGNGE